MRHHRMAGVGLVLDQHLPVTIVHVAQHAAGHFEPAGRRAVDHVVKARQAVAEKLLKTGPDIVEFGEHKAAVIVHVLDRAHAASGMALLDAGVLVTLLQGDREQRAVGLETPGVIGAAEEFSGVAAGFGGDARALVRAAVVQHFYGAVGMAHHQDRLRADGGAVIIAGFCHLAVVPDIGPAVGKDVLHLELEHLFVDIDVAVHLGLAHEAFDCFDIAAISGHERLLMRQRSSTSRGVFDREMQICMTLPAAFSASVKM